MPADPQPDAIRVIFADEFLLIADKPAGVPTQADHSGTADLLTLLNRQLNLPQGSLLPVHRLDRPIGGLLALARSSAVQTVLTRQLAGHEMEKTYHAVVCGRPQPAAGELTDYLVHNTRLNLTGVAKSAGGSAKLAILGYQTIGTVTDAAGKELTLLHISLKTGRHHQIRVQLAHAGFPLWGDVKYNPDLRHAGGWHVPALCSTGLILRHPASGKILSFTRPLPLEYPFSLFSHLPV